MKLRVNINYRPTLIWRWVGSVVDVGKLSFQAVEPKKYTYKTIGIAAEKRHLYCSELHFDLMLHWNRKSWSKCNIFFSNQPNFNLVGENLCILTIPSPSFVVGDNLSIF